MVKRKRKNDEALQEPINVRFPAGVIEEIDLFIKRYRKWINRQDFIREAVKEKADKIRTEEQIK